jgi:hypothetical protein
MSAEPGKAALDNPIEPDNLERLLLALDDAEVPAVSVLQVLGQPFAFVASVCDHGMDFRPQQGQPVSQNAGSPAIRHASGLDTASDKKALGINK